MLNVLFLFTAGYFCLLGDVKGYEGELQIRFHINSQLSETSSETSSKSGKMLQALLPVVTTVQKQHQQ